MPNDPVFAAREMARLTQSRRTSYDDSWFDRAGRRRTPQEIIDVLDPMLTDARKLRIEDALGHRTRNLGIVVEGMVDTGNIAAVMRTADGFGVQEIHVVDTASTYKHSRRTSQGAEKWLDRLRWRSVSACVDWLRSAGRTVVAAHVAPDAIDIDAWDFAQPTALVFGNELAGLSDDMLETADAVVAIPIGGMIHSFNISVAVGICLYQARQQRVERLGGHGDLDATDRMRLRAIWYMKSVPNVDALLDRLFADQAGAS